ncbi:MAG: nitrogenase-stabilizing/protective protein NifW [Oscillatoriales cyanobacterium SM2_2_1]|nr:nitrogenase-stabilizing/protective protein NifW [Oscillatoriales cyanobacterium SM2_2_1]
MTGTLAEFNQLTNAEDYFEFLELPYDPKVVNVNRLHILRKFSQLKEEIDTQTSNPEQRLAAYQSALADAYGIFLTSSAQEQKLFKVFHDQAPKVVLVSEIMEE